MISVEIIASFLCLSFYLLLVERRTPIRVTSDHHRKLGSISATAPGQNFRSGRNQTRVLKGDPNKPGLYTIQLTIPRIQIEAHTHPDDRVATVVSGTWHIAWRLFDKRN